MNSFPTYTLFDRKMADVPVSFGVSNEGVSGAFTVHPFCRAHFSSRLPLALPLVSHREHLAFRSPIIKTLCTHFLFIPWRASHSSPACDRGPTYIVVSMKPAAFIVTRCTVGDVSFSITL